MKRTLSVFAIIAIVIMTCSCHGHTGTGHTGALTDTLGDTVGSGVGSSQGISPAMADIMLNSYLNSIHATHNDTDLQCFIYNADSLRKYLNDTSKGKITQVKLMLAHTISYANSAKANVNCGYKSGALTIIIAGYDNAGNYIYNAQGNVLDNAQPCPNSCCQAGPAACDTFAL